MTTQTRIDAFQQRIAAEGREYCENLFRHGTLRLLAFKYAYYRLGEELVKDQTYDSLEQSWYVMGRALNHLNEDETSPCLDFDIRHPLAEEGIKLALHYINHEFDAVDLLLP